MTSNEQRAIAVRWSSNADEAPEHARFIVALLLETEMKLEKAQEENANASILIKRLKAEAKSGEEKS